MYGSGDWRMWRRRVRTLSTNMPKVGFTMRLTANGCFRIEGQAKEEVPTNVLHRTNTYLRTLEDVESRCLYLGLGAVA